MESHTPKRKNGPIIDSCSIHIGNQVIMNDSILLILKRFLPYGFGQKLRRPHQKLVFKKAMREFVSNPSNCANDKKLVKKLVYGWGNPAFSAYQDYTSAIIKHTLNTKGPILECGSGLSTLLVGIIAQKRGLDVWTLEHNPRWGKRTKKYLDRYEIKAVNLCISPLKDYGEYEWYSPPLSAIPTKFEFIICDGPPSNTKGGRYGLLPCMYNRMTAGLNILFDDVIRNEERKILKRWKNEFNIEYEIFGDNDPYANILIP
jgi:hypothetical protein